MSSGPILLSNRVKSFAVDAIKMYSLSLEIQGQSVLPEILIENSRGERRVVVVAQGPNLQSVAAEDHIAAGRQLLEKLKDRPNVARCAALMFDAYLTSDGEKVPAIAVEILEEGALHTFAQRYSITKRGKIHLIDEPLYRGQARSL